jgi:bis(5'-nucleosyl)-tetraphosphatase (symmetrical)
MGRLIAIGDPHGCIDELQELVKKVDFQPTKDDLYILGDFVDRGPDSAGVVRLARELGAKGVMGNHDIKQVAYRQRKATRKDIPSRKLKTYESLTEADWKYLEELAPFYWLENDWILVHAGFEAHEVFYRQQVDTICRVRWLRPDGRHCGNAKKLPGTVHWAERWEGPQSVVFGHIVHDLKEPYVHEPKPGVFCYGIDTGCCYGGRLTALVFPQLEFVQVDAKSNYGNRWLGPVGDDA